MGGFGSGQPIMEIDTKRTTDELPALDVRDLKRKNRIRPGQEKLPPFTEGVEPVRLVWTSSGFGGGEGHHLRPWFVCPGKECGRRVAILYLEARRLLLCRHCLDLVYESQREIPVLRAKRRAEKARARLGPDRAPRPKGMHRSTFERLLREYAEARREHVELFNAWARRKTSRAGPRAEKE